MDAGALKELCHRAGAVACGIARIEPVGDKAVAQYRRWIDSGAHGCLTYLEKYDEIRCDPSLLLPGAKTLISCAFAYASPEFPRSPLFADYALGDDYHDVLRRALTPVAESLGGETRICVDTAPLRERYWAQRAGVGYVARNNQLVVPGVGAGVFLAEILWTGELEPDAPLSRSCRGCGACARACPAGALSDGACLDARRCLSCLTIELRGDFPDDMPLLSGRIYGCDICRDVCPECRPAGAVKILPDLRPRPEILALSSDDILAMDQAAFSLAFRRSAVKRAKLAGLQRNAAFRKSEEDKR